MPFKLDDDGTPVFEDEEHESQWKNSDDVACLLHDFVYRNKPSNFQEEGKTEISLSAASAIRTLKAKGKDPSKKNPLANMMKINAQKKKAQALKTKVFSAPAGE